MFCQGVQRGLVEKKWANKQGNPERKLRRGWVKRTCAGEEVRPETVFIHHKQDQELTNPDQKKSQSLI